MKWLLHPFIVAEEGITLLHSRWGSFKTPIAYGMGAAVACGAPLWGLPTQRGRVLFLQVDTPKRVFFERAKQLATDYGIRGVEDLTYDIALEYPGLNLVAAQENLQGATDKDRQTLRKLKERHRKGKYDLVVIDSLRPLHSMKDTDSEVPPLCYRAIQRVFEGASILLIHHDRKVSKETNEDMDRESFAGSQAWASHATVALKLKRKGDTKEVTLYHSKSQAEDNAKVKTVDILMKGNLAVRMEDEVARLQSLTDSSREVDRLLAQSLGVSERTARERRSKVSDSADFGK